VVRLAIADTGIGMKVTVQVTSFAGLGMIKSTKAGHEGQT
jgi:hypothetical protein